MGFNFAELLAIEVVVADEDAVDAVDGDFPSNLKGEEEKRICQLLVAQGQSPRLLFRRL